MLIVQAQVGVHLIADIAYRRPERQTVAPYVISHKASAVFVYLTVAVVCHAVKTGLDRHTVEKRCPYRPAVVGHEIIGVTRVKSRVGIVFVDILCFGEPSAVGPGDTHIGVIDAYTVGHLGFETALYKNLAKRVACFRSVAVFGLPLSMVADFRRVEYTGLDIQRYRCRRETALYTTPRRLPTCLPTNERFVK